MHVSNSFKLVFCLIFKFKHLFNKPPPSLFWYYCSKKKCLPVFSRHTYQVDLFSLHSNQFPYTFFAAFLRLLCQNHKHKHTPPHSQKHQLHVWLVNYLFTKLREVQKTVSRAGKPSSFFFVVHTSFRGLPAFFPVPLHPDFRKKSWCLLPLAVMMFEGTKSGVSPLFLLFFEDGSRQQQRHPCFACVCVASGRM